MAPTVLFLSLTMLSMATGQHTNLNLTRGSSLSPTANSSLLSRSGLFAFGFYPFGDGYKISIWYEGIPQKTVIWTAYPNKPPLSRNASIVFTTDGRLVLQELQAQEKTIAPTSGIPAFSVSLLDSGNLVLYNSDSTIIWRSFDQPTDTLLPSQLLRAGMKLVSSSSESNSFARNFEILMQNDGNLVIYPEHSDDACWASNTTSLSGNATLTLEGDGRLYILDTYGSSRRNFTRGGIRKAYRGTIDARGIFSLYSYNLSENGNWSIEWVNSDQICPFQGTCGINGYNDLVNQNPVCTCLPGFIFINQEQRNLGCSRNFSAESCAFKNEHTEFLIKELRSIEWEESPYATSPSETKEDCNQACLNDCNCEAAVYQDQECRKQKLPLTFGRKNQDGSASAVTFIKIGIDSVGNPTATPKENKKENRMNILAIGVAFLGFAFVVLVFSVVIPCRYRSRANRGISDEGKGLEDVSLRAFTYGELEVATSGFTEELGRGSFRTVFKGTLSNGQRTIAVKRLHNVVTDGEVEFQNEMRALGRTHHKNLVRLLGYCYEGSNRLLVYEYMSNGTLGDYLFNSQVKPSWDERIKIASNIAAGILYLHEECESQIIHCDINPNNILMDENGCAKIADFGLAKLLLPDHSRTLIGIRGTRGYVAPEWHKNLPITVKVDVYSFGIVLLVIICCRRNVEINAPEKEVVLVDWVYDCFKDDELQKLVPEEIDEQKLERMVRIGLWCIEEEPAVRPSMKKVVLMLEGTVDIPVPPCSRSSLQH